MGQGVGQGVGQGGGDGVSSGGGGFERVEPVGGRVGGLAVSLRSLPPAFRSSTGFDHVYESEGGAVVRVSGAIHAVYAASAAGGGAAGAGGGSGVVFSIGEPDFDALLGAGSGGVGGVVGQSRVGGGSRLGERIDGLVSGSGVGVVDDDGVVARAGVRVVRGDRVGAGTVGEEATRVRRLREIASRR